MTTFNRPQRGVIKLIIIDLVLLAMVLFWSSHEQSPAIAVAVAKGKQMMDMNLTSAPDLDIERAQTIAMQSISAASPETANDLEFVNAVLLSSGEARHWQESGCAASNCAHITFFDHELGGSVEAVVNLDTGQNIARWQNEYARPGGTTWILPHALAVAANSDQVRSILGDIGEADPAMVPMSGWLADSNCKSDWCVDLTFHDPNGSGKVFHVFVNMERDQVERTFYTRARPDRSAAAPIAQREAFSDGCHEAYDWEVCWEMTAHDGIDFQDARYNGEMIFSSAKIGQVEAWYPSWPGGYRDEIGFSASVPPFGDTVVNDLGDGFEVRQFFTEFTRWPNCICCYRYEEVVRFFEDGALEFRFVSHGPGCDDLSIYRPFWRIDIDLDNPENDKVWLWEDFSWQEQPLEFEEHPLVDDVSPDGQLLATIDDDLHYRWLYAKTDPLGRDEGYFFLLQFNDNEGNGPIVTGPGDTYIPPRQWIDGEDLSGDNIVLWHVPLLKTIKGEPWWCMPDPEPDFSPCEAILRAEPGEELDVLTPVELATMQAIPVASPEPETTVTPAPVPTPRPIEGVEPEEIVLNAGCTSCHQIGPLGESHKVGPDLSTIGLIAGERVDGMPAETYIRQSLVEPNIYLAPHCPNGPCAPNIMPRDYGSRLTIEQQDTIVEFLLMQRAVVAPVPDISLQSNDPLPKSIPLAKQLPSDRVVDSNDVLAIRIASILILTLVFLLSLLIYLRGGPENDQE